jgi:hypothetical protein
MTRHITTTWLLVLATWLAGCGGSDPKLDLRWHFAGADGLRSQTAAPALRLLLGNTNAAELGARLATNLTASAVDWVAGGKADPAAGTLARPLVEDLLAHESSGEVWRHPDGSTEVVLAVRITAERAPVWTEQFPKWMRPLNSGSTGSTVGAENGWLFASSRSGSPVASAFRRRVLAIQASMTRLLELETAPGTWPGINVAAVASNGAVRWSGTFAQPGAAEAPILEWSYPTHLIRDPLIAFTAARGIAPGLLRAAGLGAFIEGEDIGQLYLWSQPETPFSTYGVVHAGNPARLMSRVHDQIRPLYSTNGAPGTRQGLVMYDPVHQILALSSAPLATPTLAGPTNGQPGFVGLSLIGLQRSTNLPPAELLAQLKTPGLVYYDWEVTSENVAHWSAGLQVKDISTGLRPPPGEGPGRRWLQETTAQIDNTVTTVRQTGPGAFQFQRKAPAGLTAFELVVLTRWLDPPTARPARTGGQPRALAPAPGLPVRKP